MICQEQEWLRDFVDDELEQDQQSRFSSHLETCASCRRLVDQERALIGAIRRRLKPDAAPAGLLNRIQTELDTVDEVQRPTLQQVTLLDRYPLLMMAASFVLGFVTLFGLKAVMPAQQISRQRLVRELVDDHIRYLEAPGALELASHHRSEAEQWFKGHLPIATQLPSFSGGFPKLAGGRRCYVLDRRVALLFYGTGQKRVSLFIMDPSGLNLRQLDAWSPKRREAGAKKHKGYQLLTWKDQGLCCALVSSSDQDYRDLVKQSLAD